MGRDAAPDTKTARLTRRAHVTEIGVAQITEVQAIRQTPANFARVKKAGPEKRPR